MAERFFLDILASGRNGTLYVGVTDDLARRMTEHKSKLVPGFTREYGVDKLHVCRRIRVDPRSARPRTFNETMAARLEDRPDREG
jgi:predicted GIY-YIG superfamily endonuclease